MLNSITGYVRDRLPFGYSINISDHDLDRLIQRTGAEIWHSYAIKSKKWRSHTNAPCRWLAECMPPDSRIYEPGCGSGVNLIWLAQRGFSNLCGSDISPQAVDLARSLAKHFGMADKIEFFVDDGARPQRHFTDCDAIIMLNWIHHSAVRIKGFEELFNIYNNFLGKSGIIIFDNITTKFDCVPNNRYHTDGWNLPVDKRKPTEYALRYSDDDIRHIARKCGFTIIKKTKFFTKNPERSAYMLKKINDIS